MPRTERSHIVRILARWALLSTALGTLLFVAAGTTGIPSLRAYLFVFSALLLATMRAARPDLVEERFHPAEAKLDAETRLATGFLFLVTLTASALDVGRLHASDTVPPSIRIAALVIFTLATLTQAWAIAVNPFFSPVVRIQSERGHYLVTKGPYRFVRHPGYLAMVIAMPASALAIGSWLALIPALAFSGVVVHRTLQEDQFLHAHLAGYAEYSHRVGRKLLPWLLERTRPSRVIGGDEEQSDGTPRCGRFPEVQADLLGSEGVDMAFRLREVIRAVNDYHSRCKHIGNAPQLTAGLPTNLCSKLLHESDHYAGTGGASNDARPTCRF